MNSLEHKSICALLSVLIVLILLGFLLIPDNSKKLYRLYELNKDAANDVKYRNEIVHTIRKLNTMKDDLELTKKSLENDIKLLETYAASDNDTPDTTSDLNNDISVLASTLDNIISDMAHADRLMKNKNELMKSRYDEVVMATQLYITEENNAETIKSSIDNVNHLLSMLSNASTSLINDIKLILPSANITDSASARIALQSYMNNLIINLNTSKDNLDSLKISISDANKSYKNTVRDYANIRDEYLSLQVLYDQTNRMYNNKLELQNELSHRASTILMVKKESEVMLTETQSELAVTNDRIKMINDTLNLARQKYMDLSEKLGGYNEDVRESIRNASIML